MKQHLFGEYQDLIALQEVVYCRLCSDVLQSNTLPTLPSTERSELLRENAFIFYLEFKLTSEQRRIVFLLGALMLEHRSIMLHAVCGAGKTEIIALTIASHLRRGAKVGWAIARRDVVIELKDRLATYFKATESVALYQDSQDLGKEGQLVVLTTARLQHFYKSFDILILDENDAYPFNVSHFQQHVADTSVKPGGNILYISATITKQEKREYAKIIGLSKRFHGKNLPVIVFEYYPMSKQRRKIGKQLKMKIERWLANDSPIFLFVSNKSLGIEIEKRCKRIWGDIVSYVSSDIKNRQQILEQVRNKELKILVTTTILERGVTFKSVQAVVLDADNLVFNAATLVQIAGRVGRAVGATDGEIYFLYQHAVTAEMRKAKKYHEKANEGELIFL